MLIAARMQQSVEIVTYHFELKIMTDWKLRACERSKVCDALAFTMRNDRWSKTLSSVNIAHNTNTLTHKLSVHGKTRKATTAPTARLVKYCHNVHTFYYTNSVCKQNSIELMRFWFFCCEQWKCVGVKHTRVCDLFPSFSFIRAHSLKIDHTV